MKTQRSEATNEMNETPAITGFEAAAKEIADMSFIPATLRDTEAVEAMLRRLIQIEVAEDPKDK